MNEKVDYFFSALDMYLSGGDYSPAEALKKTVEAYAYVYHNDDGRPQMARAATIALTEMKLDYPDDHSGDEEYLD